MNKAQDSGFDAALPSSAPKMGTQTKAAHLKTKQTQRQPKLSKFSGAQKFEFYMQDLLSLNPNQTSHQICTPKHYLQQPVYICAIVYICRLLKKSVKVDRRTSEVCLQLACKYLEVHLTSGLGTWTFPEQLLVISQLGYKLFISEKTFNVYQRSLTSQYQPEIDQQYKKFGELKRLLKSQSPTSTASSTTSSCDPNQQVI